MRRESAADCPLRRARGPAARATEKRRDGTPTGLAAIVARGLAWAIAAALLGACARGGGVSARPFLPPEWELKKTVRLGANELWREHDGAAGLYVDRGCLSETLTDYRHRTRPWAIRCSVFELTAARGARSLFDYYHNGVDGEVAGVGLIGEATYLSKSPEAGAWIVGFCRGKFFVEASLAEDAGTPGRPGEAARQGLLEFGGELAGTLR